MRERIGKQPMLGRNNITNAKFVSHLDCFATLSRIDVGERKPSYFSSCPVGALKETPARRTGMIGLIFGNIDRISQMLIAGINKGFHTRWRFRNHQL